MIPAKPVNEKQRLETLWGYEILDTEPEAARLFGFRHCAGHRARQPP